MTSQTTATKTVEAPCDNTEVLQCLLETNQIHVSYQEAFEIGQSLISLCEAFTTTGNLEVHDE
jgi:hypothetical protein